MWSSQVGKTNIADNTILVRSCLNPGPMMLVSHRVEDAKDYSKTRLRSMIDASPVLRKVFADENRRNSGSTLLFKKIVGGFLKLCGANSPAGLASRSIRDLILDEKDRYNASAGKEGAPDALAKKRTATFYNRKIINISSPGIKNHSLIEADYLRSDMREYYVRCPHCDTQIVLKHEQLKCENEDPETTVYLCQSCTAIIDEADKPKISLHMKLGGTAEWIPSRPFAGHAGFKLTEMYSPWRKWKEIMKDFIEAKNDAEKMKVFVNTSKAETWEISGEKLDWEKLFARREFYTREVVPLRGLFLTGAVDVQKDRLEVEVKAWGRRKESWSVQKYILFGDTKEDEVWSELDGLIDIQFAHEGGQTLPVRKWAVDSGYNTSKVYDFVRKYPASRVLAIKGMSDQTVMVSPPKALDVKASGKRPKKTGKVWGVGVDIIKEEFHGLLQKEPPTREEVKAGVPYPSGYCHYPDYEEAFFKQLTAEVMAPRKRRDGTIVYEWVKIEERNEGTDLHVYNRAMAYIIGIDRFSELQWQKMEKDLNVSISTIIEERPSLTPIRKKKKKNKNKIIMGGSGFLSN